MMKFARFTPAAAVLLWIALAAGPVFAQSTADGAPKESAAPGAEEQADDQAFRDMVRGVDVLLDRETMEARWPDAQQRMIDVATDESVTTYERWRATSMLGNFPEPEVEQVLLELTADSEERIRATAYYVLGTAFLDDGDDRLFDHLKAGLDDDAERVHAEIVRSFGWTDHEGAHRLLQEIAAEHDDEKLRRIATRSLQRH